MNKSVLLPVVVGGALIAGLLSYQIIRKTPPASQAQPVMVQPVAETVAATPAAKPVAAPLPITAVPTTAAGPKVEAAVKADPAADGPRQTALALLREKNGAAKWAALEKLVKSGQVDAVVAQLKLQAQADPNNPSVPTTIGEALIAKLRELTQTGGDMDDVGILAMQADQSFNSALKLDPNNYEAQLVKATSMRYWPSDPVRDAEVVQRLSSVIDQQEALPVQPGFAQPYVTLGEQYQKMGQPDKAMATWQMGLQKYPNDPGLMKKMAGQ